MISRRTALVIVLVLLVAVPAAGSVAFAQSEEGNETTAENATDEPDEAEPEDEAEDEENETSGDDEAAEEDEAADEGEGDGGTEQVTLFDRDDNQPALTPEDVDGNESGGTESGNESTGESTLGDLSGDESGDDDGDRSVISQPSTEGITDKIIGRFAGVIWRGGTIAIEDVVNEGLGTQVPENDGYRGILGQPVEGDGTMYSQIYYDYYFVKIIPPLQDLLYVLTGITFMYVIPAGKVMNYNTKRLGLMVIAGTILVVVSWEVATFMHWVSDSVTQFFLPDAEDILNPPGSEGGVGTMESTSGAIGTLLGVSIFGWNAGMALLILQGARHVLLAPLPAWLGVIFLIQFLFPVQVGRQMGSLAFWGYVGLLVYNWPTALLLGAAEAIEFNFGMDGMSALLADFGVTTGIFMVAAFLPVLTQAAFFLAPLFAMYKKGSVMNAGRSFAKSRGWMNENRHREKKGGGYAHPNRHHDRVTTGRGRAVTDGGSNYSSRNRGVGGTPTASSGRSPTRSTNTNKSTQRRALYDRIKGRQAK